MNTVILTLILLYGVTWIFRHHHWRPLVGLVLFVIGVGSFNYLKFQQSSESVETTTQSYVVKARPAGVPPPPAPNELTATTPARLNAPAPVPQIPVSPAVRPAWVDQPSHLEMHDNIESFVTTATAAPEKRYSDASENLQQAVQQAVADFVDEHMPEYRNPTITLDPRFVRDHLIRDQYDEDIFPATGPEHQLHALLVFDSRVRTELSEQIRQATINSRLRYTAEGTLLGLVGLGAVYWALRFGNRPKPV